MKERSFDEMIAYFNRRVSEMDIAQDYKMELLGMVTALGYKHEQTARQWIPCSERLPDDDIKVLVTDEDGDIYIAYYDYNEWSDDPKIEWWTGEFRIYPIAWMPLPEPYQEEEK